jgi:hypothetical protein
VNGAKFPHFGRRTMASSDSTDSRNGPRNPWLGGQQ